MIFVFADGYDAGMLEDELNVGYDDNVMYNGNDYTVQPGYGPGYVLPVMPFIKLSRCEVVLQDNSPNHGMHV